MTWIAEDVPWYSVSKEGPRSGMTDEDYAMSAPRRFGEFATERDARNAVALDLINISTFDFVVRGGEREKYVTTAEAVLAGVDGVRIHGRFYRVREA